MAQTNIANVTITAITGAGQTDTAHVYNNVREVNVNLFEGTIDIVDSENVHHYYEYTALATFTWSISSHTATVTLS